MTYEPLHHKYRPQTFAALVGQQAIATTLTNALRQRRIAPAYLFTGARGTGKTSSARILAKSLNCLKSDVPTAQPCGICEACRSITGGYALDVVEIDAASNTGVDHIRELIERSQFAPVQCRYKVYVIDECHMLSIAAFNALLKTLEEPPDRVVFVLATTDPQRVLPTIISRCQRFDFRRIPLEEMVTHLAAIAQQEQINIHPAAIQLIAQISQGGLRDAESLMDQLSLLEGQVTIDRVWDLVGAVPERDLLELVKSIAQNQSVTVIELARRLMDRGREPLTVLQNLASFYRDLLIAKTAGDRNDLVSITPPTWLELCQFVKDFDLGWIQSGQRQLRESELQVKTSTQPRLWLEVTLLGLLPPVSGSRPLSAESQHPSAPPVLPEAVAPVALRSPTQATPPSEPTAQPFQKLPPPPTLQEPPQEPPQELLQEPLQEPLQESPSLPVESEHQRAAPAAQVTNSEAELDQVWQQILGLVQPFSTQMMLRQQCHLIALNGQEARIGTKTQQLFKMAKDRLPNIEEAFTKLCSQPVKVTLEVVIPGNPQESSSSTSTSTSSFQENQTLRDAKDSPSSTAFRDVPPHTPDESSDPPPVPLADAGRSLPPEVPPTTPAKKDQAPASAWQEEDEVMRAAKSLAQMFNGQIVNLEGEIAEGQAVTDLPASEFAFESAELEPTEDINDADDDDDDEELPF